MNKKAQELAMHDKDTGSSEIQIALLTEKIETLSKHIKQFKKDKHSSVGLLRAVNRRKKLLEYLKKNYTVTPEELMLDKAHLLGLTAPEMTVLVGGMRSLGISSDDRGIFSDNPQKLTSQFFTKLLDMSVKWEATGSNSYQATDRQSGDKVRRASRTDLVFGSNSQLRALAEVYAQSDNHDKFLTDFISAWNKVMNADRFDLEK